MSTARTGREREWRVIHEMQDNGWLLVSRSAGSKGAADAVLVHPERGLALVQVGTDKKRLGPAERTRLCYLAGLCGALAVVARVIPRQGIAYTQIDVFNDRAEGWAP